MYKRQDLSNPEEPVKVAEHKDIEDDGQTVLITERIRLSLIHILGLEGASEKALINSLCKKIDDFNVILGIPATLKEFGIKEDELDVYKRQKTWFVTWTKN